MNENLPIKDKMAVILHGIVGGMDGRNGMGSPANISDCSKTIKYNVLSAYDCDVFIHSWSINHSEEIMSLYNPTASLFQPQEFFNFSESQRTHDTIPGQPYRSVSRFTSLERSLLLKRNYEESNGFKYKWVFAIRFDLVFFNKIDLSKYDPQHIHICLDPYWGQENFTLLHDILFLSNSDMMNNFIGFPSELLNKTYDPIDIHHAVSQKIFKMVNNERSMIEKSFKRYEDVEIYRLVMRPELNDPTGHPLGSLATTGRFYELMKKINKENNG
jgi:hypothetical protein